MKIRRHSLIDLVVVFSGMVQGTDAFPSSKKIGRDYYRNEFFVRLSNLGTLQLFATPNPHSKLTPRNINRNIRAEKNP